MSKEKVSAITKKSSKSKEMELPEDFVYDPNVKDELPLGKNPFQDFNDLANKNHERKELEAKIDPETKKVEEKKRQKELLAKMFEQYKEQDKERPAIELREAKKKEKVQKYKNIQKAHDLLNKSADMYDEFEQDKEKAWYEDAEWNKKLEEAQELDRIKKREELHAKNEPIIAEIKTVKEKLEELKKIDLEKKLKPLLNNIATYEFLDTKFINEKNEKELIVNQEYLEKDYTKSIFFLAGYLTLEEIQELVRTKKGASREEHLEKEFYTISDKDLDGGFGDEIVKIKKRDENKNLREEEIKLRDLVSLGQKRMSQAIKAEDQTLIYMKKNKINNISPKVGKIIYHDFPKIKLGKKEKEVINQIPFDMAFVVAHGYYGADSFATFDKENGKISLVSSPKIVNKIYTEIKEIIPDFPAPIGVKLLTPDDPEIIKQIREKMSEEKWQEILGVVKVEKTKPETLKTTTILETENKTAHVNTDEGAEDEDSLAPEIKTEKKEEVNNPETEREQKLKRIEEIKIRERELQEKIKNAEENLQKILEKIEEFEEK